MQDDNDLAKKALMQKLVGPGIAPGEDAPNAGPPPIVDAPMAASPMADAPIPPMAAAPGYSKGANAGKNSGMILGYDTGKLNDPTYQKGTKYNDDVRAFSGGLKEDVGVSRGGLGNMVNYLRSAGGRPDAMAVGDDKIDFDGPGPQQPIDVIRADGQIVFQDPRGAIGGGGGSDAPQGGPGGGPAGMSLASIDPLLSGDPMAKIQAALAQLSGPRDNAQELLRQLVGGRG